MWFLKSHFKCCFKTIFKLLSFAPWQSLSCLGRKSVLPRLYLCVVAEVSWQVLRLFLSWKLCIAFSITSASDNPQKLVPRDQFCFLCSTPRLLCQEPESVSFDLPTCHLEHSYNAVRLSGLGNAGLVRHSGDCLGEY